MVGAGRERSAAPSSSARGGRGTSIPTLSLRKALIDSLQIPVGASSSASLPTKRGDQGKKRAGRAGRGRGRGGQAATPSSPPPQLIHPST